VERRFYQNRQKHVNTIFSDFFAAGFAARRRPQPASAGASAFAQGYGGTSRRGKRELTRMTDRVSHEMQKNLREVRRGFYRRKRR
jgi:hypothetical protein